MVLEQLFKTRFIERKPIYAFWMGIFYSLIGFLSAYLIFGANVGLMAVAFTSILLIPTLNKLLQEEENAEIRESKFSLRLLFKNHKDVFEVYLFVFMGILLTHTILSVWFAPRLTSLFSPQLAVAGITGMGMGSGAFVSILLNNLLVLVVCFILSLVYGAGAVIFLTWNASVWGSIIGYYVLQVSQTGMTPSNAFLVILLPLLPHMITETLGYLSASIVGGVVSKAVTREKLMSKRFMHVLTDALLFLGLGFLLIIIAAALESFI
jgi:hypothetical protein